MHMSNFLLSGISQTSQWGHMILPNRWAFMPTMPRHHHWLQFNVLMLGGRFEAVSARPQRHVVKKTNPFIDRLPTPAHEVAPAAVTIPIGYYEVLGLPEGVCRDDIVQAHQELRALEIEDAYTTAARLSRQEVLDYVRSRLLGDTPKRGRDSRAASRGVYSPSAFLSIPWAWLPGALALLEQVGEAKTVMNVGHAALKEAATKAYHHDILLAMALSQCSLARLAFEKSCVAEGFEALVRAHALLKRGPATLGDVKLIAEIEASLEGMAPACTLEHLGLPRTPDSKERRDGALAALGEFVRQKLSGDPACSIHDWDSFLHLAMGKLHADEILQLLPWEALITLRLAEDSLEVQLQRAALSVDCLYTALIAHIAAGFNTRAPHLVEKADKMAGMVMAEAVDLRLERAICAFLLGKTDLAFGWLTEGLGRFGHRDLSVSEQAWQKDPCMEALQLINECSLHSVDADSDLAGLCFVAERWLKEVALGSFPDTCRCLPSLVQYYEAPEVQSYLSTYGGLPSIAKLGTAEIKIPTSSSNKTTSLCNLSAKATPSQNYSTKSNDVPSKVAKIMPDLCQEQNFGLQKLTIDCPGLCSSSQQPHGQSKQLQLSDMGPISSLAATTISSSKIFQHGPSNQLDNRCRTQLSDTEVGIGQAINDQMRQTMKQSGYMPSRSGRIIPERQWNLGKMARKAVVFAVLASSTAAVIYFQQRRLLDRNTYVHSPFVSATANVAYCDRLDTGSIMDNQRETTSSSDMVSGVVDKVRLDESQQEPSFQEQMFGSKQCLACHEASTGPRLHDGKWGVARGRTGARSRRRSMAVDEAEILVQKWQRVKADALGPAHVTDRLSESLGDPMLLQWQTLAEEAKQGSCHWRFMLLQLQIVHADIVVDEEGWESAEVEAILEEAAELVEDKAVKNPNYYSTYRARYELQRSSDRTWRICRGSTMLMSENVHS